jgi:hypothetical protein
MFQNLLSTATDVNIFCLVSYVTHKTSKGEKSVNLKNLWGYFVLIGK